MNNYTENTEEVALHKRMLENTLDGHPYVNIEQWVDMMRSSRYPLFDPNYGHEKLGKETLDIFWEGAGFYPFA